jgi:hypothetical protein
LQWLLPPRLLLVYNRDQLIAVSADLYGQLRNHYNESDQKDGEDADEYLMVFPKKLAH